MKKQILIAAGLAIVILLFIFCGRTAIGATEPLNLDTKTHKVTSPGTVDFSTATVLGLPPAPPATNGLPVGGAIGQLLQKLSATNYDTGWITLNTANWDTAYTDRLKWDGGATGLVAATGRTSLALVPGVNVEAWLSNPPTDGYIVSSTAAGVRGWIAPPVNTAIYSYSSNTTMADPGNGKFRGNNALLGSATQLALSAITNAGSNIASFLRSIRVNDTIYIQDQDDATVWIRYNVTATATDNTTWFQFPVSVLGGSGSTPLNNAKCLIQLNQTGANAPVSSVFSRVGAVVAATNDYTFAQIGSKPTTLAGYGITDPVVLSSGSYANPAWITSLAWSKVTGAPAFEPALGNPSTDGYILSSTAAGARSWIVPPSGGGGGISGSGTANQLAFFSGSTAIGGSANLTIDAPNGLLTLTNNTTYGSTGLKLVNSGGGTPMVLSATSSGRFYFTDNLGNPAVFGAAAFRNVNDASFLNALNPAGWQFTSLLHLDGGFTVPSAAKGDLMAADSTGLFGRVAVGSNGQLLSADSTSTNGIKWVAAPTGTVTNVSSGNFSPLFNVTVSNPTNIPSFTFTAQTAAAGTVFCNNTTSTGAPVFVSNPRITAMPNLTSNGFVKTGGGLGTLSVDTSTYLTGNQTITLTGDATGSGTTSIAVTVGNVDGVNYPAAPATNTVPLVTAANTVTYTATTGTGNIVRAASPTFTGTVTADIINPNFITGTTTNDSASAGQVGEYKTTLQASTAAIAISNNAITNVATISLTAGDWDVSAICSFSANALTVFASPTATVTTTSASLPDDGTQAYGAIFSGSATTFFSSVTIPTQRFSLSATTTVYLVGKVGWAGTGCKVFGSLFARRVR